MSEELRATLRRALGATAESRALVTAVLPAVSHGMRGAIETDADLPDALEALSDPSFSASREQVIGSLRSLGMNVSTDTEFTLLMSAVQTAVFVVHYARSVGEDPTEVWQSYIGQMVGAESGLDG